MNRFFFTDTKDRHDRIDGFDVNRTYWMAIIATVVAFSSFGLSIYLITSYPGWQVYLMTVIAGISFVLDISIIVLARQRQASLASRLLFWSLILALPLNVLLFAGIAPILIGIMLVMGYAEVFLLFPPGQRKYLQYGPIVSAVVMMVTELIQPALQLKMGTLPTSGYWGPFMLGILVVGIIILIGRQAWAGKIRVKLLFSTIGVSVLAVGIFGAFVFYRNQQTQTYWTNELQNTVQQQSQQEITSSVEFEAHTADQELSKITDAVQHLADYRGTLFTRESYLGQGGYWDGNSKLILRPSGEYGNSVSDPAAIFIPNTVNLSPGFVADLNTSLYLDFSAPAVLKENTNIVAVYYVSADNYTVYYPNIDLASNVPPDFNAPAQSFYTVATPENNPEREAKWTAPYQDPAGTGLIVTTSVPVYDPHNQFRGVMSADIQLSKISEQISTIKLGETGFAFLIDPYGHIIAMPEEGYTLFGIEPEVVPVNESPKTTILGLGSTDFQNITQKMVNGETGLATATIQNTQYYIAYSPLPTIKYSIGLIASSSEMDQAYLAARQKIQSDAQVNFNLFIVVLLVVAVAAIVFGIFLSQSISSPLIQLTNIAAEVSKGNLNVRANIQTADEIGALASTFNNMTSQLRETLQGLEQRVADRTKALVTSAEVSRHLAAILDPRQLASEVVNEVRNAFDYYYAQIYLLDDTNENLVIAGGTGEAGATMMANGHSVPKGSGLVGRAAEANVSVLVPDVSQEEGWLPNELLQDTKAEAAVPISIGDQVLGVLDVQHNLVNGLTPEDVTLLNSLAGQVAITLLNARTYEESRRRAELESLVNVIGQKIQRTTSVEDTLQTAIRELGAAIGASRVRANIRSVSNAVTAQPVALADNPVVAGEEGTFDPEATPAD